MDEDGEKAKRRKRPLYEEDKGQEEKEKEGKEGQVLGLKRHKFQEREDISPLAKLPIELLYSIHLYAKNPAFTMLNRHLYDIFSSCPVSIKAKYLIARWHEAYCYGFYPPSMKARETKNTFLHTKSSLPSSPSTDLLEGGSIPELNWSSRFLPVIPVADWPHPLSNSFRRSADHFILDHCLTYPICSYEVLRAVEDIVLSSSEFGNIALATGLWKSHKDFGLCTYKEYYDNKGETKYMKPCHLMVNELPKRIFRKFNHHSISEVTTNGTNKFPFSSSSHSTSSTFSLDPQLTKHLEVFGSGPLPSSSSLLLFLAIISLHIANTFRDNSRASGTVNSYEGMPLAKSVFSKSQFMVQMLLFLGAEPSKNGSLALYVAIRSGWLEGLQTMIERDDVKYTQWKKAIRGIREWFQRDGQVKRRLYSIDTSSSSSSPSSSSPSEEGSSQLSSNPNGEKVSSTKRRRLSDRVHLNTQMLKEAIKHNQWAVANYIRSKGVIPDLRTIQLIELKQGGKSI